MNFIKYILPILALSFFSITSVQASWLEAVFGGGNQSSKEQPLGGGVYLGQPTSFQNLKGETQQGFALSCEKGDVGFCASKSCDGSSSSKAKNSKGGQDNGIKVSKETAEFIDKHLATCIEEVCGEPKGQLCGVGGQNPRTVANSKKQSRHGTGDAFDIKGVKCPDGRMIDMDLKKGSGQSMQSQVSAKSAKGGKGGIRSCSHAEASEDYKKFAKCWGKQLKEFAPPCPDNKGGALTAAKVPKLNVNVSPDAKKCHHNDHIHISFCAKRDSNVSSR